MDEKQRKARTEENKRLKQYLRSGHKPEVKDGFIVFPLSKDKYTIKVVKNPDGTYVHTGFRRASKI